jgi:hypothetical protein
VTRNAQDFARGIDRHAGMVGARKPGHEEPGYLIAD